jgi:hypothetical protein
VGALALGCQSPIGCHSELAEQSGFCRCTHIPDSSRNARRRRMSTAPPRRGEIRQNKKAATFVAAYRVIRGFSLSR